MLFYNFFPFCRLSFVFNFKIRKMVHFFFHCFKIFNCFLCHEFYRFVQFSFASFILKKKMIKEDNRLGDAEQLLLRCLEPCEQCFRSILTFASLAAINYPQNLPPHRHTLKSIVTADIKKLYFCCPAVVQ